MSLSTITQAVTAAARDFAGHTSSTPPDDYFARLPPLSRLLEDPCEGLSEDELDVMRARLSADTARRQALARAGLRTGSSYERRRLGLAVAS